MTSEARIERGLWWDRAWSLVEGCTPVSAGCAHCWAAEQAHMRSRQRNERIRERYAGLTDEAGRWNGVVRCRTDALDLPLRVKRPTTWAVWNDLFNEQVPVSYIAEVFEVMASWRLACRKRHCEHDDPDCYADPGHTFVILTKRPVRMARVIDMAVYVMLETGGWPLPNVVLGVSVEDQATADERIPWLLRTPAAKRVVSYEPALGPVDFGRWVFPQSVVDGYDEVVRRFSPMAPPPASLGRPQRLDGVIAGCETGRQRRPASSAWFRSVRDQCVAAGVPFFLKAMEVDGRIARLPWLEEFRGDGVMRGRRWDDLAWGTNG